MSFDCYVENTRWRLTNDLFGIEDYLALTGLDGAVANYQGLRAPPLAILFAPRWGGERISQSAEI
jgi:hypothetical protein